MIVEGIFVNFSYPSARLLFLSTFNLALSAEVGAEVVRPCIADIDILPMLIDYRWILNGCMFPYAFCASIHCLINVFS